MAEKFIRAGLWDKTQYLFRNYYDRMMHCVLYFDGLIDVSLLKRALKFQVDEVPVLHSRYHNNFIKPYWVVQKFDIDDVLTVKDVDDLDAEVDKFVTQRIPIKKNVQLQIGILNHDNKSTFIMVSNHMCFVGGDFKYFVTNLFANYTKLTLNDQNITIKHGSRNHKMIYSSFSEEDQKVAKKLYKNISQVKDKHHFPLTEKRKGDANRVIRRFVDGETFSAMHLAGKSLGFTIHDVLLAVYFRSLFEFCGWKEDERVSIQSMVDLRRHLKNGGAETGLTNHTGFMACSITGVGKDIGETLKKVQVAMKDNKADKFLGLYGIPLLNLAYTIFPHCISETAIKIGYQNPLIGMSNIGRIIPAEYKMGNLTLIDGWYTGAIKGKPFVQLAFTTFEKSVTFSMAICGNSDDDKIVEGFFDVLEKNIHAVIDYAEKK